MLLIKEDKTLRNHKQTTWLNSAALIGLYVWKISLWTFSNWPHYNIKIKYLLFRVYVLDQIKVAGDNEVE